MTAVFERIYVGGETSCRGSDASTSVVHACKTPCHQRAIGYRGALPSDHPHYLVLRRGDELFLNMIDPPAPLFKLALFEAFMTFAKERYDAGATLLIHCNLGISRSPSLALLFLAKHLRAISSESFEAARADFLRLYPCYQPAMGIRQFLEENWGAIQP
jgi:hypothetical protein